MSARGWLSGAVGGAVWGTVLVGAVGPAAADKGDPAPKTIDIKPLRDKLEVLVDAAGGTYVVYAPRTSDYRVWYGIGPSLYEQVHQGRSMNGDAWSLSLWAPRIPATRPASIDRREDGTYRKSCAGQDEAELTLLTGAKADAVLAKVTLKTSLLVRRPHVFSRDDNGVYYYVDRLSASLGGKGFRVFVGRKGAMKLMALSDVASDSAGDVFSTRSGSLRLATNSNDGTARPLVATWIRGERRVELITLDVDVNSPLIFTDLGIYKQLGTLCDNI